MRTNMSVACFAIFCLVGIVAVPETHGQDSKALLLKEAESRLRAIYDRGEFRAKRFSADWLPDSSGYTVMEPGPGSNERVRVRYDAASGERTVLKSPGREGSDRFDKPDNTSPDGQHILYSDKGNLRVRDLRSDRTIDLTRDADGDSVSNGRAVWSPDGKRIAFVRSDFSKVRLRPVLIHNDPSYPEVKEVRFARVGETIPSLRVGIVDAEGGDIRWLSISEPAEDFYLGQISWAGNSDELLVEKLSRFRDERDFLIANVHTGAITCIYHETDPAWVVASIRKNAGPLWIRDHRAFIVLCEKDGWRHAYVYSRDGEEQALLTPDEYDIIELSKVDEAGGWFYYYASPDNGTQKYLYRVPLDGTGKLERITPTDRPGTHDYEFSPDAKWAFHTYSTFDTPAITELVQLPEHKVVRVLEDNKELRGKMEPLITHPTEFLKLDIGGGVVMDAWMIKPDDFDPSRKYPVFVHVYGEPHSQTVLDVWGRNHADYHRMVADLGYLVVSIDNRGTPAPKGAAWRRAVFGSLGPLSTEEQAAGLQELGRMKSYVDLSRVGIWGWSGGGSNTLNAMFRKPDVYHVGIAVAAKPQPHLYNAGFQENYMRSREVNPEGYRRAAAINFAEGLKGDLLIIHGSGETNTHIEIMEGLVDRLIELGKQFDYMVYPNRDHGLHEGRGTDVHMRLLMVRYLLEHLPPGPR
ncbi:MAG TPA: DPP IV N-terminal domain-containing protein [Sedimentisphaerales bacterium]|nr:DPP IV N-terminal domain-containing protein [Sedimentisphaerales bacterium]